MIRALLSIALIAGLTCAAAHADDAAAAPKSKHQMMKECMAKQKASDGGMPKEEMKKACRDVTATERENAKTEKKDEAGEKPRGTPRP